MPQISARQEALRFVKGKIELNIALQTSSSDDESEKSDASSLEDFYIRDSESDLDILDSSSNSEAGDPMEVEGHPGDLIELYAFMDASRYLVSRHVTPKSKEFAQQYFANLPPKLFRQMTRMDKQTFFALLSRIENHPIFENESHYPQAPIVLQLGDSLGHEGNGSCLNHLIPTWGVSNGSLVNFSQRCFYALDDALAGIIKWPDHERKLISLEFAKKGFPNCVVLIDGTLIPLSQRPKESGECYYDRKSRYNINAQVVCDSRRPILYLYCGMPGSCQDITCFKRSRLYQKMDSPEIFSVGEYILGDSAYIRHRHMVCAFKRSDTARSKERFNTCVAKCRVVNEHCIGVLKSRWHSLKQLRVQLKGDRDISWMVKWVGICANLHNFVISMNDGWIEEDEAIVIEENEAEAGIDSGEGPEPRTARERQQRETRMANQLTDRVMDHALRFHSQPGGCLWE